MAHVLCCECILLQCESRTVVFFSEEALEGSSKDVGTSAVKSSANWNQAQPASVGGEPPQSRYPLIKIYFLL